MSSTPESEPESERRTNLSRSIAEVETTPARGQYETVGEPFPEWSTAIEDWGAAWYFHQYVLGAFFALLGVFVVISLAKYHKEKGNRRKKVPYIVLTMLALFGWSRGIFLSLDAYHSKHFLPTAVLNLLWGVGQPCIITAYSLVFIVLRNVLLLRQQFQKWYTTRNIALVTIPYFVFALAAELAVTFVPRFKGLTFVCQIMYTVFGFSLASFYLFVSVLMWKQFRHAKTETRTRSRTRSIFKVCLAAVFGGLAVCAMQLYAMSDVYGVFSEVQFVPPWPWFVFHTILRIVELYMAILLYFMAVQRNVRSRRREIAPTMIMSGVTQERSKVMQQISR